MKVLITGCSGYIGHQLTFYLSKKYNHYKILGIDNIPPKNPFPSNVTFIEGDALEKISLIKENNFDIVIHLAAFKDVSSSMFDKKGYIGNDLFLTQKIVDSIKFKNCKFIFTSSSAVYGNNNSKMREYDSFYPVSIYGFAKLASEYYIEDNLKDFLILRPFNVSGYIEDENVWYDYESPNLLFRIIKALMKDEKMNLYISDSFRGIRDYIHIAYLIEIIEKYINGEELPKILNVCSGTETSVLDAVNLIQVMVNKKLKFDLKPNRPGEVNYLVGDPSKFFNYVQVKKNLHEILFSMIKTYGK